MVLPGDETTPATPTPQTPDQQHDARVASDARGRASGMVDLILRTANPTEMETFCTLLKPTFTAMSNKLTGD